MVKITLDITKNVNQNASIYFDKVKVAKKKLKGATESVERAKKRLELEQVKYEKEQVKEEKKIKRKPHWYEKFRWFVSSEGFLVLGGRDATTNEIIVKKHTEPKDVVFHTDMSGSPFFTVKAEGKEVGETTLQETSNATFMFSRALKLGLMTSKVFWVNPDQVSKEAQPGEYLTKGSFMIRGKTNYISPEFGLAIGSMEDGAIMCGPAAAVKKNTAKNVELKAGGKLKTSDLAKRIKKQIGGEIDDIVRALPPANVEIKK
jgi:predicted ribosome quality control (RQC) complex YloA/Tae2 family protein